MERARATPRYSRHYIARCAALAVGVPRWAGEHWTGQGPVALRKNMEKSGIAVFADWIGWVSFPVPIEWCNLLHAF